LCNTKTEGSTVPSAVTKGGMLFDSRSSKSSNRDSRLDRLAIPVVEKFVVSTSVEIDLSSQKSNESDTQDRPGLSHQLHHMSRHKGTSRSSFQDYYHYSSTRSHQTSTWERFRYLPSYIVYRISGIKCVVRLEKDRRVVKGVDF
jgi:hypothetical protein